MKIIKENKFCDNIRTALSSWTRCYDDDWTKISERVKTKYDINDSQERICYVPASIIIVHNCAVAAVQKQLKSFQEKVENMAAETQYETFFQAAQSGNVPRVRALLENGVNINATRSSDRATALILAVGNREFQVVDTLLKNGADVNVATTTGMTPLMMAIQVGHITIFNALLAKNADVNACLNTGAGPLFLAAQNGRADIVRNLLDKNADMSSPFVSTVESLNSFAKRRHIEQAMTAFINQKKEYAGQHEIRVKPAEIAAIMGYAEIKNLIDQAEYEKLSSPSSLNL